MKELKCKICGGSMILNALSMSAQCQYCGAQFLLDHEDTDYYRNFFLQMSKFLSADSDERERKLRAEELWKTAKEKCFICADGNNVAIRYMYKYSEKDADVYVARRNIIFHFKNDSLKNANKYRRTVSFIDYPSADTRNLSKFFPKVSGGFDLADGTYIIVIAKDEDEYPLRLFGKLNGRHVAWVISRMENLCCVLEYNNLAHPQINEDTLYINPYTHQASLYGNWWNAEKNNTISADGKTRLNSICNLEGLRNTAAKLLGFSSAGKVVADNDIPEALAQFINSTPCTNAYDDFAMWDKMLIEAYGERKFINMATDDEQIYGKE